MNLDLLNRLTGPIWSAIRSTFARSVVRNSDDSKGFQVLQVDLGNGDLRSDVERWQNYGFTSRPLDGAEGFTVCPGGDRSAAAILGVDDRRYRPKNLVRGEVVIYTDEGVAITLRRGRQVSITGADVSVLADGAVSIGAATINLTASSSITLQAPEINLID